MRHLLNCASLLIGLQITTHAPSLRVLKYEGCADHWESKKTARSFAGAGLFPQFKSMHALMKWPQTSC